jgi:hypothetical protein
MRKKTTTRRRSTTKKLTPGKKIAIGLMVAGGGFLAWKYLISPMINKPEPGPTPGPGGSVDQATQDVVNTVQTLPVNTTPPVKQLSPIGTPGNQQNWGAFLKYGERGGEIETFQKLINRIYQAKRSAKRISVDGAYGNETLKARNELFNKSKPVNLKLAYDTFKQFEKGAGFSKAGANFVPTMGGLIIVND